MRRSITIAGFALLACLVARPVAAQQHAGQLAKQYADEGKKQLSQAKRYSAAPRASRYSSAARSSLHFNPADASGRIDMSGHAPLSYFKLRDPSAKLYSPFQASAGARGQAARARSNYYSKFAKTAPREVRVTPTRARRGLDSTIPPAPR